MLSHKIDIAVHSMKDVPAELPKGLIIDCMLEREDPRDCFVSSRFNSLKEMPKGTIVGSSSARRAVLVKEINPNIEVVPFRGNVITRLKKIETGEVDAAIFAIAGLKRLGLESVVKEIFDPKSFVPAVGQGAIGIERRTSDLEIAKLLSKISHKTTVDCVTKERIFMKLHGGNCTAPIGAYTDGNGNYFTMHLDSNGDIVKTNKSTD
jgi:hydroxymethylbilane synthase